MTRREIAHAVRWYRKHAKRAQAQRKQPLTAKSTDAIYRRLPGSYR